MEIVAPAEKGPEQGYRNLAAAAIMDEFLNYVVYHESDKRFEKARQFFCSEVFDDLAEGLGLDPCVVREELDARRDEMTGIVERGDAQEFRRWYFRYFPGYLRLLYVWEMVHGARP